MSTASTIATITQDPETGKWESWLNHKGNVTGPHGPFDTESQAYQFTMMGSEIRQLTDEVAALRSDLSQHQSAQHVEISAADVADLRRTVKFAETLPRAMELIFGGGKKP